MMTRLDQGSVGCWLARAITGGLVGLLVVVGGCNLGAYVMARPAISAALQFVSDNAEDFVVPAGTAALAPTEPVQDVEELDGCWGRFEAGLPVNVPDIGDFELEVLKVVRFDAAVGTVRLESYSRDELARVYALMISEGTYEVAEAGVVTMRFERYYANDPETGAVEVTPGGEARDSVVQAEVAGEVLVLSGQEESGVTGEVYYRFDCPE